MTAEPKGRTKSEAGKLVTCKTTATRLFICMGRPNPMLYTEPLWGTCRSCRIWELCLRCISPPIAPVTRSLSLCVPDGNCSTRRLSSCPRLCSKPLALQQGHRARPQPPAPATLALHPAPTEVSTDGFWVVLEIIIFFYRTFALNS